MKKGTYIDNKIILACLSHKNQSQGPVEKIQMAFSDQKGPNDVKNMEHFLQANSNRKLSA